IELTKRANLYQADVDRYTEFLQLASAWFDRNLEKIWNIICSVTSDEVESITYDSFKASMHSVTNYLQLVLIDAKAPFNDVEMHLVAMLLDPSSEGSIEVKKFAEGILGLCKEEEVRALKMGPSPLARQFIRWVRLHFRNATLASIPHHPLHFDEDVPSFYTADLLIDIIRRRNHICAPSIKLLKKKSALQPEVIEQVSESLAQLGIEGGTRLSPTEVTILYQTQCSNNVSRVSLFIASINDCYLLWDEAALWLEDFEAKTPNVSSEKSQPSAECATVMGSDNSGDSDSSSVDSLASFFTVEKASKTVKLEPKGELDDCEIWLDAASSECGSWRVLTVHHHRLPHLLSLEAPSDGAVPVL
ncbi:unnamed protein product, partial [Hydatigera taeniaeformis]|uniref:Anaphase-promoting complex subunit 2 n=1 Tax=Hydatigena taeniaeformis TaxID=6205 RepID=A0A0R3X7E5_HYDTA